MEKQLADFIKTLRKLGNENESDEMLLKKLNTIGSQWDLRDLYERLKNLGPDFDLKDLLRLFKKFGLQNECKDLYDKLKNLGILMNLEEFYKKLKKFGFEVELKINEEIFESLNKEDIMKFLHQNAHIVAPIVEGLQDFVETISIPLNFPTKNDVANVAQLTLQNEDKIDSVLEQLLTLNEYLKKLTSEEVSPRTEAVQPKVDENKIKTAKNEDTPTNHRKQLSKEDENEADRKLKKKLLLLDYILQSSNSPFNRQE